MPFSSKAALMQLDAWGLTEQDAETAQLWDVPDASAVYRDFRPEPAVVLPYFNPDGSLMTFERDGGQVPFCRVRYLSPTKTATFTGNKAAAKYGQPGRSGTRPYFPLNVSTPWAKLTQDVQEPCILTEGEAKGLAGCAAGFPVIALGGVFSWSLANGEGLMPELEAFKWRGRDVFICFDSDRALNGQIRMAEARLVDELHKRGARCFLVEIPPDGDRKIGLDDFIKEYGATAFTGLLQAAVPLGALDAKVVALNKRIAWIDREGMVFDNQSRQFVQKANLIAGHELSSLKHITVGGKQRAQPKAVSVVTTWLTHAHAARYGEILFRPGMGPIVDTKHGQAMNLWDGWDVEHGVKASDPRIVAFMELTTFLFQHMETQDRELPFRLMAYKAQNPMKKVGLCLVLIGDQGCGKSLWCETVASAFAPHSDFINSAAFGSEFNGWTERSVLAIINEANAQHVQQYGEKIKSLITDLHQPMRELYRPMRQVESYTMYIMTANDRAVGSFSADDRRMIVVDCPPKLAGEAASLYTYLGKQNGDWHRKGGPAALMGYLLEYDLKGWTPPLSAPMTAEKINAYHESLTPLQELAAEMLVADGNSVVNWIEAALAWAHEAETSNIPSVAACARATLESQRYMPIRPFYTPRELSLMFPAISSAVLGTKYDRNTTPGKISRDLRNAGIKYLRNRDNPAGFKWKGQVQQYLIVAEPEEWRAGLTQAEFDRAMNNFPTYGKGPKK